MIRPGLRSWLYMQGRQPSCHRACGAKIPLRWALCCRQMGLVINSQLGRPITVRGVTRAFLSIRKTRALSIFSCTLCLYAGSDSLDALTSHMLVNIDGKRALGIN